MYFVNEEVVLLKTDAHKQLYKIILVEVKKTAFCGPDTESAPV